MDRDNRTKVFILVENLIMEDSHPLVTDFPSEFQNILSTHNSQFQELELQPSSLSNVRDIVLPNDISTENRNNYHLFTMNIELQYLRFNQFIVTL